MVVAVTVAALAAAGWSAVLMRTWLRRVWLRYRESHVGEQVWFEVVQETARKNGPFGATAMEGTRALTHFLSDFSSARFRGRPRLTFAWMRSADDSRHLMRLYVGVNEASRHEGVSALQAYTRSIGARLRELDEVPQFPYEHVTVARRERIAPGQVSDSVDEIGVVSESIAATAESHSRSHTSAVYITLDGAGSAERAMLADAMRTSVLRESSNASVFASGMVNSIQYASDSAVRMTVSAATSAQDPAVPRALLTAALASVSTLGYTVKTTPVRRDVMRAAARWAAWPLATAALVSALSASVVPLAVAMLLMGGAVAAFVWWPDACEASAADAAASGQSLVPEFLPRPLSLRRAIERGRLRWSMRGSDESDEKVYEPFPSGREVLTAHPTSLFEMLTFPAAAGLTAGDRTQSRGLPPDMVDVDEGIFLGLSGTGQPTYLDIEDLHYTMYTAGAPNSGKSNLLLVLYAGVVKACMDKTAGLSISPIWGETKGEGAYQAWRIARRAGRAVFVDVHNPRSGWRMALEGPRLSDGVSAQVVASNCTRLVSSLQAAYGDGIRSQAREIFDHVLRCAMLMTAEEIEFIGLGDKVNAVKPNIMEVAFYLLHGDSRFNPTQRMISLGDSLKDAQGLREKLLSESIGSMSRFWEPSTQRTYLERMSTVLNKISDLRSATLMWTPDEHRRDIYPGQLVESFVPSVVNMGSYWNADIGGYDHQVDRAVSQRLIRSFNYLLWDYIKGRCNGWQEARKRVPMFFDEVADVAVNAEGEDVPNTLEEGTKEGRSRGAAYFLGSQYPSQMPAMVRHQVLASRGKFWFGLQNSSDLDLAVQDLQPGDINADGAITPANIKALSNGVCFATIPRNNSVTPPLLLKVPYAPTWTDMLFDDAYADTADAAAAYAEQVDRQAVQQ